MTFHMSISANKGSLSVQLSKVPISIIYRALRPLDPAMPMGASIHKKAFVDCAVTPAESTRASEPTFSPWSFITTINYLFTSEGRSPKSLRVSSLFSQRITSLSFWKWTVYMQNAQERVPYENLYLQLNKGSCLCSLGSEYLMTKPMSQTSP